MNVRELTLKDLLERVDLKLELEEAIREILKDYNIGELVSVDPLLVGHEEFNCKITTNKADFVIKFLNKRKSYQICKANVDVIQELFENGINVPMISKTKEGEYLYRISESVGQGFLFITEYFPGKTFNQIEPNHDDFRALVTVLAEINNLNFQSVAEDDFWLLKYLSREFEDKSSYLSSENLALVTPVVERFKEVELSKLSKGVVHNDLHRDNVMKSEDGRYCIFDMATVEYSYTVIDLATFIGLFVLDADLPIERNKEVYQMVIQEYQNTRKLNEYELEVLWDLVKGIYASNLIASNYLIQTKIDDTYESYKWYELAQKSLEKFMNVDLLD